MLLQYVVCIILANSLQLTKSSFSPARRGREMEKKSLGYCELYPHCTCVRSRLEYNVYCEDEVSIHFESYLRTKRVSMACKPKSGSDVYKYLSILRIPPSATPGIDFSLHSCPLPIDGYASLFYPKHIRIKALDLRPYSIQKLYIHCERVKDFRLNWEHLIGLDSLTVLTIYCSGMNSIDPELLAGVSRGLIEFRILESFARVIPPDLVKNHASLKYLELKSLGLKTLPLGFIGATERFENFSLEENALIALDDDIFGSIKFLIRVNLSKNRLIRLPKSVCKRPEIMVMELQDNQLTYIDEECFSGCREISHLYLDRNKLQSLHPMLLVDARSLRYFSASHNFIGMEKYVDSTDQISGNQTIEKIFSEDVRFNVTASLHEKFFESNVELYFLNLKNNSINVLPEKIFHTNRFLSRVNLSYNRLGFLTMKLFENNMKIVALDISHNFIVDISDSILTNFRQLITFNLSENQLKSMGESFFHNISLLKDFDVSKNWLENLSDNIFLPFNQSVKLLSLQLSMNMLERLPLLSLPSVSHLNLAQNKLVNLTADTFELMKNLEFLNISHNLLQRIGIMIFNSGRIKSIDLSNNRIDTSNTAWMAKEKCVGSNGATWRSFRERYGLSKLENANPPKKLEHLNLSNNSIVSFYSFHLVAFGLKELSEDISIVTLDLSRNKISFNDSEPVLNYKKRIWGYESQLAAMKTLEVLLLPYNKIQMVPLDWRHDLPSLRHLDLRHNRIKYLWHQDLLFSNGVFPGVLPSKYFIPRKGYFQFSNSHKLTVDLRYNLIEGVEFPEAMMMDVPKGCRVDEEFGHATVLLGNNPFVCGCQVYQLLRYALKEMRPISELEKIGGSKFILPAKINISGLSCWNPLTVKGKMILEPETWSHHLLPLVGICHGMPQMNLQGPSDNSQPGLPPKAHV